MSDCLALTACGGGESAAGNPPGGGTGVSPVGYLSASSGGSSVGLSWSNPSGNFSGVMLRRGIGSATDWKAPGVGDMFSFAIKTDGTLWGWGQNSVGQLGCGSACVSITGSVAVPTQVGGATNWKQIDGGWRIGIGLRTDGTVWTWGAGYWGELGTGYAGDKFVPTWVN